MSRYKELLVENSVSDCDVERKSLFYILANNDDLYSKINYIYDFKEGGIKPECLEGEGVDLCSSSRKLITLGYNLFNGYTAEGSDVLSLFSCLDHNNFNIVIAAIRIRFNQ